MVREKAVRWRLYEARKKERENPAELNGLVVYEGVHVLTLSACERLEQFRPGAWLP
jgi:hypothetical protein